MRYIAIVFVLCISATICFAQQTAPSVTAPAMDGTVYSMDALKGKIVVVNLWFINCPNCLAEIKMLNDVVAQYKDNKDVVFLGFAASRKADLEAFLKKNPFNYTIIPNAQMLIVTKFGTPDKSGSIEIPFPMHYVFDRTGKTVVKVQGTKGVEAVKAELVKQTAAK